MAGRSKTQPQPQEPTCTTKDEKIEEFAKNDEAKTDPEKSANAVELLCACKRAQKIMLNEIKKTCRSTAGVHNKNTQTIQKFQTGV